MNQASTEPLTDHQQSTTGAAAEGKANTGTESSGTQSEASQESIPQEPPTEQATSSEPEPAARDFKLDEAPKEEPQATSNAETTGVKKVKSKETRAANGLPKVTFPKMLGDTERLLAAKERVDAGQSNPAEIVNRILDKNEGYRSEDEVDDMQYYAHQLAQQSKELLSSYEEAKTPEDKAELKGKLQQLDDAVDAQTKAALTAGNKWGKIGNRMQPVVDVAFNPIREQRIIKENYGGDIPEHIQKQLDTAFSERDEAIKALKDYEANRTKEEAAKAAQKVVSDAKKSRVTKKIDAIQKERGEILDGIKKKLAEQRSRLSANPIPVELIPDVAMLLKNYAAEGVVRLSDFVDRAYDDLKGMITDLEKSDVEKAISQVHLNEEKEKLSKKADRLEGHQEGLIFAGNAKLLEPNPKPETSKIVPDSEMIKLNQRIINAEHKIKMIKQKSYETEKSMAQRGADWVLRWHRRFVLAGTQVLEKLASAATIGGGLSSTPEEIIGGLYSKLLPALADKAPIEGYLNAKAEAAFWTRFVNLKKTGKNAIDIIKTGTTDLSKRLGEQHHDHYAGWDIMTDIHSVIKDPLKEAEFNRALTKITVWAAKQGYDINEPLVHQALELSAYKKANYAIFQEDNEMSKWFNNQVQKWQESDAASANAAGFIAQYLIPVNKTPLNIVKRMGLYSTGLVRGVKNVYDAYYKKGIENLTPEETDVIFRQLKKGTAGNALLLAGFFGTSYLGGMWNQDNPDKKRKDGELPINEMLVDGKEVPHAVQHAMPLMLLQLGATFRLMYDTHRDSKESIPVSTAEALLGTGGVFTDQMPIISTPIEAVQALQDPAKRQKFLNDLAGGFVPQGIAELAQHQDTDASGKVIKRDEKTIMDAVKAQVPGIRQTLPTKQLYISKEDAGDPTFKYFLDKKLQLPNTSLSAEKVTDAKAGTNQMYCRLFPKKMQDSIPAGTQSRIKESITGKITAWCLCKDLKRCTR
jgi:hypothetical protein